MRVGDEALQKAIESERTGYARIAAFIRIYVPALTGELGDLRGFRSFHRGIPTPEAT